LPIKVKHKAKNVFTKKRRPYKKYDISEWNWKDVLDEALILKESEKNYIEIISNKYGIVHKTLRNNICKFIKYGTYPTNSKGIHNNMFTEKEENELANDIKLNYIDKQKPFDNDNLKLLAMQKWEEKNSDHKHFNASNGWCSTFKRKWGLSSVKPNKKRISDGADENTISQFKKDCIEAYKRVGPDFFYNMDETFWLVINFINKTFGRTGSESTQIKYIGNDKQGFTALLCISARGKFLKPFVIKKGKTKNCLKSFIVDNNLIKCNSNNGWVNDGIIILLLDVINNKTQNKPSVLLLDKHPAHDNEFIMNEAKKRNICLIFVPSGYTFKYQPLDVGVNGPLKSCARKLWKKEQMENSNKKPCLSDGARHLSTAINEIITEELIKKSFMKALPFLYENIIEKEKDEQSPK
jgi:hypothetical protein